MSRKAIAPAHRQGVLQPGTQSPAGYQCDTALAACPSLCAACSVCQGCIERAGVTEAGGDGDCAPRQVFIQRAAVNLLSTVLDTPEFFWSAPDIMQTLYKRICEYMELGRPRRGPQQPLCGAPPPSRPSARPLIACPVLEVKGVARLQQGKACCGGQP